ncbi:MAG: hypothetical protein ACJA08_000681 [Cyclobacteriaceae bacterium]|jgi:hypothetical protein
MKIQIDDIEKKNPYQVPDGYFLKLTSDIQAKVVTETNKYHAPQWIIRWAMVPALMVMVFAGYWIYDSNNPSISQSETLLAAISDEEILSYLDESELSLNELVSLTSDFSGFIDEDANYLQGLDLENENIDDLINAFDLKEI